MSTEAALKALSNSQLASGAQIPATKHRTVNDAIIEELFDAQSRGDVLTAVQQALTLNSGDQVFVIRGGQAYLLSADEFGFIANLVDLNDVNITSPLNNQILVYDSASSKYVLKNASEVITASGSSFLFNGESFELSDDGSSDVGSTIQALIDNVASGENITMYFPQGVYRFDTQLLFQGYGRIEIIASSNATLRKNTGSADGMFQFGTTVNTLENNDYVKISGGIYDLNNGVSAFDKMIAIYGTSNGYTVENASFINFGIEVCYAIQVYDSPALTATASSYVPVSGRIDNCDFYNPMTWNPSSIDYNSNNALGTAIYWDAAAEYATITNCRFNNIARALQCRGGANATISSCVFNNIYSRTTYGAIHIEGTNNNGKITISESKFHHNLGYCIYLDYDASEPLRPLYLNDCTFIANSQTAVYVNEGTLMLNSCKFDRSNIGGANDPFPSDNRHIYLKDSVYSQIVGCQFNPGVDDTYIYETGTTDYTYCADNYFSTGDVIWEQNSAGANSFIHYGAISIPFTSPITDSWAFDLADSKSLKQYDGASWVAVGSGSGGGSYNLESISLGTNPTAADANSADELFITSSTLTSSTTLTFSNVTNLLKIAMRLNNTNANVLTFAGITVYFKVADLPAGFSFASNALTFPNDSSVDYNLVGVAFDGSVFDFKIESR
jgi:hypothetical protein